jgi:outer membrane receptor protein involved in Fe transport
VTSTLSGEQGDAALEEVVVVAQRRAQNIQDVPAAVSALDASLLERANIVSVNQLGALTPNFQVAQPFGASGPGAYTIRGISSTDFNHNQSRPVAIYIDEGVRQLPALEFVPFFDLERVEILRGPQGALYGKNATGGAVNIITKEPGFETEGYVTLGYGNFNRLESQGALQLPIASQKLAARVAYTYIKDDGVIENVHPGVGDLDQTDIFGVRASLLFEPSDEFKAVLRYNHSAATGAPAAPYATDLNFASAGFPSLAAVPGSHREGLSYFENDQESRGSQDLKSDGANLRIDWALSDAVDLTSITTYDEAKWIRFQEGDGLPLVLTPLYENGEDISQFVQELRLAGEAERLRWLIGAFYARDSIFVSSYYPWMTDPRCGAECDFGIGGGGIGYVATISFPQKRKSYAAFVRAEYEVLPSLTLTLGGRYSEDEIRQEGLVAFVGDSVTPQLFQTIGSASDGGPLFQKRSFSRFTGEASLSWEATEDLLTYASFKQGYRSGAFNAFAVLPEEATIVPPETADSFELGVKAQSPDRRVTMNLAGFYTEYKNQQIISAENGTFPLRSVDRARIWGIETDLTVHVVPALTLTASVGYADPKYQEGVVGGVDVAGNQITNAAEWTVNVGADWRAMEFEKGSVNLHVDAQHQSQVYFDINNTPSLGDDGHTIANAQLSFNSQAWDLELWVTNLTAAEYANYGVGTQAFGFSYLNRGMPRQYGARVRYNF